MNPDGRAAGPLGRGARLRAWGARLAGRDPGLRLVVVAALALTVAYAWWALQRDAHFLTNGYDLGIFDQATWHLAHFEAPASSLREIANLWGDHLHPVIAVWAALRWLWPSRDALLVSQAVLVAAAMVPIYLYARDRLSGARPLGRACERRGDRHADGSAAGSIGAGQSEAGADRTARAAGVLVALAYGTSWGVQRAIDFDVHELAFAPLPLAGALLAVQRGRWRWFWVCVLALLLVKEDVALLVVALGVWLVLGGERRRGLIAIAIAVAWFVLATRIVIPHLSEGQGFTYWSYGRFGDGPLSALGGVATHPWRLVTVAVDPSIKVGTMLLLLAPFALVTPWLTRTAILVLPLFAERFLSDQPVYWGTVYHYSLLPTAALALASADGLVVVRGWAERRRRTRDGASAKRGAAPPGGRRSGGRIAAGVALVGLVAGTALWPVALSPNSGPLLDMGRLRGPVQPYDTALLRRVVAAIPARGSVAAPQALEPKLTSSPRDVFLLDMRLADRPPHVADADTVAINLLGLRLAPLPDDRGMTVMRTVERRLALGSLVPARLVGGGWAVLRSASTPGVRRDPALRPLSAAAARRAQGAVADWGVASLVPLRSCRADAPGICPPDAVARWRALTTRMAAELRAAASATTGPCRDLLAGAAHAPGTVVDAVATASAAPRDARRRQLAELALRLDGIDAPRRALLVCAPDVIAPPPAPQPKDVSP